MKQSSRARARPRLKTEQPRFKPRTQRSQVRRLNHSTTHSYVLTVYMAWQCRTNKLFPIDGKLSYQTFSQSMRNIWMICLFVIGGYFTWVGGVVEPEVVASAPTPWSSCKFRAVNTRPKFRLSAWLEVAPLAGPTGTASSPIKIHFRPRLIWIIVEQIFEINKMIQLVKYSTVKSALSRVRCMCAVCIGRIVVTTLDCGSGGPGFKSGWVPICCKARSTAQGLSEPSSIRGSTSEPVQPNIKTATGCKSNRQLQLWTVFVGTVVSSSSSSRCLAVI